MPQKNVVHGPADSLPQFKNLSIGQLLLNQLNIHRSRVAQVNNYNIFFIVYSYKVHLLLLNNKNYFR